MPAYVLPSRTQHPDADFAKEGAHFPVERLLKGARERLALFTVDAAAFGRWGFKDDWKGGVEAAIADLETKKSARDLNQSDHAAATLEVHAFHDLVECVKDFETGISNAFLHGAPPLKRNWQTVAHIAGAVPALIAFAKAHDFPVGEVNSAAFATRFQAALDAFNAAHAAHTADSASLTPDVVATRVAAGLVAYELIRLANTAKRVVAPERISQYSVTPLRVGRHEKVAAPAAVTPAPKP